MLTHRSLTSIPRPLDVNDIQDWDNVTLFSDDGKKIIKARLKDARNGFYAADYFDPPLENCYGVSKHSDGAYYFIRENPLGEGISGIVYLGQDIDNIEKWVAIKEAKENIGKESETLQKLNQRIGEPLQYQKEDGTTVHQLTLKYVDGINLLDFLASGPRLCARQLYDLAVNIVKAIHLLHQAGWLHRDIKLGNLIYDLGVVKVVDYGATIHQDNATDVPRGGGSQGYEAPEVRSGKEKYTYSPQTDIYSLGKVLQQLFGFILLIEPKQQKDKAENQYIKNIISDGLKEKLKKITDEMISDDPEKRPSSTQVVMDFLLRECNCLLPISCMVTGIISTEDCHILIEKDDDDEEDIFTALKSVNEIVLTQKNTLLPDLQKIKKKLEKNGIRVRNEVFNINDTADIAELPASIRALHDKEEENNRTKTIHSFCYFHCSDTKPATGSNTMPLIEITDTATLKNYRQELANNSVKVTLEDHKKVYDLLEKESYRLHIKFHGKDEILKERLELIEDEMTFLYGNTHVTYSQLFQRLEALQSKMEPTKRWLTFICQHLFGHIRTSTSADNIGKELDEIHKDNPKRSRQVLG